MTLFQYIFLKFARNIIGVYLVVLGLIFLVDFVEHLRRASDQEEFEISAIALMVFYHAPSLAEQIFPFAVLFGSMASFMMLSRTLELAVVRAAGVSVWQFVAPGAAFAFLLGVFATTIYSPVVAEMRANYDRMNFEIFGGRSSFMETKRSGSWLRQRSADGEAIIHAKSSMDLGVRLADVTSFVFDSQGALVERVDAETAVLRPGRWDLGNATVSRPDGNVVQFTSYVVSTNLSPEQVREIFGSNESIAFWDLPGIIDASDSAGLEARGFRIQYHMLLVQPLSFAVMVYLAATVSLRIFRFGNLVRMILGGVAAGFMLYVMVQFARDLGMNGLTSPALASWLPVCVAMVLSFSVLLYQEDG